MSRNTAAAIALAGALLSFTAPFEGLRTRAYPDPADPNIATVCYGETQGVRFGQVYTPAECREMFLRRAPDYINPVLKRMPHLPDNRIIAYADFAYNGGPGLLDKRKNGIPGTSIVDLERAGHVDRACARLKEFVYAGGKVLPGLVKRREKEYQLCMKK